MKFIKDLGKRLNPTQKTIVAVTVPLMLLVITYVIAAEVGSYPEHAFDMEDTWLIWVMFLATVGYFEFHLYSD